MRTSAGRLRGFLHGHYTGRYTIRVGHGIDDYVVTIFPEGNEGGVKDQFRGAVEWIVEQLQLHTRYRRAAVSYFDGGNQPGVLQEIRTRLGIVARKTGAEIQRVSRGGRGGIVCVRYFMPKTKSGQRTAVVRERCGELPELMDHFERLGERRGTPRRSGEPMPHRPRREAVRRR